MKEKLNKKEQHKLYTLFTIYRSNIVGKTNQFKHNSLFIIYSASDITLSDSVCRLEATNTGFCWLLTSVTCHVIHVTQTVIGPMQTSTVGGVSLRLRWNNHLKFVPINV